jgi:DNA polymerase elongation subunit (family B)
METKRFILLDIDYVTENGRPVVRLFGKERGDDKGRSIIALDKHFRPYIYVIPRGNIEDCIKQIYTFDVDEVRRVQKKDINQGKEMLEVILFHPQDVPKLRDKIWDLSEVKEIREHDIPFSQCHHRQLLNVLQASRNVILGKAKNLGSIFDDSFDRRCQRCFASPNMTAPFTR